jgi:8-oxo-dGTP pyrophosphatase MutT (NUDIX family)
VRFSEPPPGERLNTSGKIAPAREAASTIVLRDTASGPEVLLVQRNPEQRFMGGAWVFPGGTVHEEDGSPEQAARRELEEEAGIRLPGDSECVPFSRWITPIQVTVRFDTWFFAVREPDGAEARCDGAECVDHRWARPAEALAAGESGELSLMFPTIKHLEQLAGYGSVEEALGDARAREVEPIQPRVLVRDGQGEVLLPGEPGYEEAE